jgi:TetR/AcrR family transcriptional regulator, transcriptional repressor for nem operon
MPRPSRRHRPRHRSRGGRTPRIIHEPLRDERSLLPRTPHPLFCDGPAEHHEDLRNDSLRPLHRLRQWFDIQYDFLKQADFRNGCLIGNFSAEVGAHSDTIHAKLAEMQLEIHESAVYCLKAAVKSGELPGAVDCKELAHFLYSSLQGAILQAKVERSPLPLKRFIKIAFSTILR